MVGNLLYNVHVASSDLMYKQSKNYLLNISLEFNDCMCLKVQNKSQNSNYFIGLQSRGWLATGLPQECQVAGRLLSQRSQLRQCPGEYTWSKRELNNYTVWKEIKCSVDSEILHQLFRDNTRKLKKHELIRVISCAVSRNPHTTSFSFEQCAV